MTNTPQNQDNEPEVNSNRRVWLLWLSRSGLAFGAILLVGIAAGAWWAWNFVQTELAPLVERNLTQSLKRPVRLGKVERFSLTGLRLGASEIPATTTDRDRANVGAVDVTFAPIRLLLDRTLALNVTLVNPNLYLEQDPDGRWLATKIAPEKPGAAIKTEVESIRIQNANVVLVPQPKPGNQKVPVGIASANGSVQLRDNNQRFRFELGGQLTSGGNLFLEGEYLLPTQQINLQQLQAQQIQATEVDRLLKLPLNLQAGLLDASLQVKYNPTQPLSLLGTARLYDVTAGLPQQPIPFAGTNGTLLFQEQVIKLQNVTSRFGQIPLVANGGLDLQKGYDIAAKIPNIEITKVTQTFNFKAPVVLNGEVQADVKLTGAIAQPLLIGQFATTKPTLVDKVNFSNVSARFALDARQGELIVANLQAKPVVGGEITGKGQVKLGTGGGLVFDVNAQNVPGDAIATLYKANLPPSITIGQVAARSQVFGSFNDLRTVARWQAPQATYPGNGEVVVARGQTILRGTTLRVAGGTLQVGARIANGRWDALVEGDRLPVGSLLDIQARAGQAGQAGIPPAIGQGRFTGRARLAGTLASFQAKDIQAVASGRLQVAGGTLQIQQAGLNAGNWEALIAATEVQLTSLLTPEQVKNLPVQPGAFTGRVRAAGNLASTEAKDIRAVAQGSLNVAGGTVQIQQAQLNRGNWEALIAATEVQLTSLLTPEQVKNLPVQPGAFTGRVRAAGNLASSDVKDINAAAQGSLNVAGGRVQIQQAQLNAGKWNALVAATNVQLTSLLTPEQVKNLPVQPGAFTGRVRAEGNLASTEAKDIKAVAQGRLNLAGGTVQIQQAALVNGNWEALVAASGVSLGNIPQVPPQFQQGRFNGQFRLAGNLESTDIASIRALGNGNVQIAGGNLQIRQAGLANNRWQAVVAASGLQLARLLPPEQARNLPIQQGRITGEARLEGSLDSINLSNIQAVARGSLQTGNGALQIRQAQLNEGRWQAVVDAAGVQLNRLPQVSPQLQATFSGRVQAAGRVESLDPKDIQAEARGRLNIAGGTVQIQQAQLNEGRWRTAFDTTNLQLNRLATLPNRIPAVFSGNVQAAGSLDSFQAKDIQAEARGSLNIAGGRVQIQQASLEQGRWRTNFDATGVELNRLATLPNRLPAVFSGNVQAAGNVDALQPKDIAAIVSGNLNVAGGTVQIQQARLEQGRWQASIANVSNIQLSRVNNQLRGVFNGENLQLAGNINSFSPADIQVAGSASFSQGIGPLDGPLAATFAWKGQQLQIEQATAPGLNARGVVALRFNAAGTPQIGNFDLNVAAQDLNLRELPLNLPNNIALAGRADFTGRASGTLTNPTVNGELELRNLAVNNLAFESPLRGNIQTPQGRGVGLDLSGTRDRIAVQLDRDNRPETFLIQRDGAVAEGRRQGDELIANVRNLLIELVRNTVQLPPALANQEVSGTVSGNFALNLNDFSVRGDNVAVANAQIGRITGYQIAGGSFSYRNGEIEITGGELQRGESRYAFTGRLVQTAAGPEFDGRVQVAQGDIQEVFKVARLFNLLDLGRGGGQRLARAAAVQLAPVGVPGESLQNQLRRFSEIEALREQEREIARGGSPLPTLDDLENLTGTFSGSIDVANASPSNLRNLRLSYDLQGQNLRLDEYKIKLDRVIAQGSFANGIFTVSPLRIESGESLVAFSGNLGLQQEDGELEVRNFPVAVLRNFVTLPFDLTGNLNANARLSGNLANPQVGGNLELVGGTLNQTPVESARANFEYNNARLEFQSQVLVAGPEPINIQGSVPFELPFAAVKPDSDRISLNLSLQNEGLALLSLLTRRQVEWISGVGQVQLEVGGTLRSPVPTGFATVQNASLRSQILQDQPLTGVTGTIRFERDRLIISREEPLQGQYSQGQVIVGGVLPINRPLSPNDPDAANPLTITLNQLALNLRALYQGQANGNVAITGTALNPNEPPEIGGSVELTNGRVLLSQAAGGGTGAAGGGGTGGASVLIPEFNNLQLTLGRGVQVAQPPILSFQARGNLTINGALNDIQPNGIIRLESGQVNLFAAQFNLARNYNHTAEFTPDRKLDPLLNVRLVTTVPEVTRSRLPSANVASEISDELSTDAGALRTVRIQATVIGPASQITDNLELTSNPSRSREEIVSLIGGGFVQTLGQGTDSTLGLANLAGSVILPGLQSTITSIGQAIGLSELRIFPTAITSEQGRDRNNSTLGLAAEAGIDITNNLSASILRILTSNQPTQFNLRYRINNEFLIRGSTDFSGDNRGVIEFERRF